MEKTSAVLLEGLTADSLGNYLASLGLLSLMARKWPSVRVCWRNGRFCIVGGAASVDEVTQFIAQIGFCDCWNKYDKSSWDTHKKKDIKKKTSVNTALWRALMGDESSLSLFGAHMALGDRIRMNPLLGTGGNSGNRDFAKGWADAVKAINQSDQEKRIKSQNDLQAWLEGCDYKAIVHYSAASWFGSANKIYNNGTEKPYQEGKILPWAMALACEGLIFFSGGPSRQLSSRRHAKGAFPFVTDAAAAANEKEKDRVEAEAWLPIWRRPMTKQELLAMFTHGRSELAGRGATTSISFSLAILKRGVDRGVEEFKRFQLLHTTSQKTFESRLVGTVPVPKATRKHDSLVSEYLTRLRDTLPREPGKNKKGKFWGLRGPLETALIDFAASASTHNHVESAWNLVDKVFVTLSKVDRNRRLREGNVEFRLLPGAWAASLFLESMDSFKRETRLALSIASLHRSAIAPRFIEHMFGVNGGGEGKYRFEKTVPFSRVWGMGGVSRGISSVAERRIVDVCREARKAGPPFNSAFYVSLDDIQAWLSGEVDEALMQLWLNRLCLFDWDTNANSAMRELHSQPVRGVPVVDGMLSFYAFFRPLFRANLFKELTPDSSEAKCLPLLRIVALLRSNNIESAISVGKAAYASAGIALADYDIPTPHLPDPDRFLAALTIPSRDTHVSRLFGRWLAPTRT